MGKPRPGAEHHGRPRSASGLKGRRGTPGPYGSRPRRRGRDLRGAASTGRHPIPVPASAPPPRHPSTPESARSGAPAARRVRLTVPGPPVRPGLAPNHPDGRSWGIPFPGLPRPAPARVGARSDGVHAASIEIEGHTGPRTH